MKNSLLIAILLAATLLCGCTKDDEKPEQRLHITLSPANEISTRFEPEDLFYKFDGDLKYSGVADVRIELDGKTYPLENAIIDERITLEEIVAFAQIDARNGICKEIMESKNGLTTFTYRYHGVCDLSVRNDLYETPDGEQHLIKSVTIFGWTKSNGVGSIYTNDDGSLLDKEDWGLSFEMSDITPEGLVLHVTQSGGQQIGHLQIAWFDIYSYATGSTLCPNNMNLTDFMIAPLPTPINMGDETEITLDWTEYLGSLPSGKYVLQLGVDDVYEESEVHPLMKNYYDTQGYSISFEIP